MGIEHSTGIAGGLPWPHTVAQAVALQRELAAQVQPTDVLGHVRRVAGIDVGFPGGGSLARAAVAVLSFPELRLLEQVVVERSVDFPYMPGLLSFRELPAMRAALSQLAEGPDLLLVDGQGCAHPRRFGIACHLGVVTGLPSIGVAKTRLTGQHEAVPDRRGAWVPLRDRDETIGVVLRTREGVRPVFVSVGHRVSLEGAIEWVMACTGRYRLPLTTRAAHAAASGGHPRSR